MTRWKASRSPDPEVLSVARQVANIVRRVTRDPAYRAFLFGSWASGEARERSDIDVGIEGPTSVDPAAMLEIREACDALPTLYTVEVVDFMRVPPDFRREATSRSLEVEPS
jgi:predicted nucleotidyltransferase